MNVNRLHLFEIDTETSEFGCAPYCYCGHEFKHPIHLQHNGDVCDILMWPCVCGSWHPDTYVEEENAKFIQRISTPGYQLTEAEAIVIKIMTDGA